MKTIRERLLVTLIGGLAVVLAAGGAAVYLIAGNSLVRQLDARVAAQARAIAAMATYENGVLQFDAEDAADVVGSTAFELRRRSGELIARSSSLAGSSLPVRDPGSSLQYADADLPGAVRGRVVWLSFTPAVDDDEENGIAGRHAATAALDRETVVVAAALDRTPVDRAMTTLLGALIAVGGVVGITVGGLVAVGVRWSLGPLDRLSRELHSVGERTISTRFADPSASGELVPIYRELNRMLDRVEGVLERERAFVDAAAHELRTPLAELRSAAEVAIRWPEPARASAVLHEVLAIGGEMERLVESLLLISRGDAGGEEPLTSPTVPADTIVPACLDRCNGAISDKAIRLSVQLEEGRSPRAPRDALTIIVRNLVDNAVQYTPVHGRIAIRSEPDSGGSSTFVVENGPVELEAGDLPRLFEPFWRTDTARSDRDHLGLGLAIVQRVAEAVGLRVDARLAGDRLQLRLSSESAKRCAS